MGGMNSGGMRLVRVRDGIISAVNNPMNLSFLRNSIAPKWMREDSQYRTVRLLTQNLVTSLQGRV